MEIEVDWDLHAVVRGCYTTTNNLKNQQQQPPHVEKIDQNHDKLFRHESMLNLDSFTTSTTTSVVTAPPSPPPPPPQHQPPELFDQLFRPFLISPLFTPTTESRNRHLEPSISSSNLIHPRNTTTASRSKRRKSQFKKVCEVPAAGLATDDKWSWRKYGQKPIKGSPYPRGYYRCSSSKGCPARKQVERSRTDPNKFIITYTSEHNHAAPTHRNSLAGISRHQNSNKLSVLQSSKPGTSSSSVPTSPSDDDDEMQQSVKTEVTQFELDEILCHEDDEEEAKDVLLDDDFFDGLDEMKLPLGHQIAPI